MPQFVAVGLLDADGTTTHTFQPVDVANGIVTWEKSSGVPIGNESLTYSLKRTAAGKVKATIKLVVPKIQSQIVSGVDNPVVVRKAYADLTLTFDNTSSAVERLEVMKHIAGTLNESNPIGASVRDVQGIY